MTIWWKLRASFCSDMMAGVVAKKNNESFDDDDDGQDGDKAVSMCSWLFLLFRSGLVCVGTGTTVILW
jgi:hypothetical protein